MTRIRTWLRSVVLRWLGYGFDREGASASTHVGTLAHAIYVLQMAEDDWRPLAIRAEYGVRRVPDVPAGTVRVVLEVCQ